MSNHEMPRTKSVYPVFVRFENSAVIDNKYFHIAFEVLRDYLLLQSEKSETRLQVVYQGYR